MWICYCRVGVAALAALKRKKVAERDLKRVQRTRLRLQMQLKSLSSVGKQGEDSEIRSREEPKKPNGRQPLDVAVQTKGGRRIWRWKSRP